MVEKFEVNRYLGKWYEIARNPNWFQKGCVLSTATYSLGPDGDIMVRNECTRDGQKNKVWQSSAIHYGQGIFEIKATWLGPFQWVVDLFRDTNPNYVVLNTDYDSFSIVGTPDRKYWWILSRQPTLPESMIDEIKALLVISGYRV